MVIIEASVHGKVVADIAVLSRYNDFVFLDDDETTRTCAGWPVVGKSTEAQEDEVVVVVEDAETRKRLIELYSIERSLFVLIHPSVVVAKNVGIGTVVMAGAVISLGSKIGRGAIVNTRFSIDHDCVIGDYSHISVSNHVAGTVKIGNSVWIGAEATISNNVNICSNITIGAEMVVIKDIKKESTYIGVPAKKCVR